MTKAKAGENYYQTKKKLVCYFRTFFLDPIWWMFVTYLPLYLADVFKLNIKEVAFSAWVPYVGAMVGSIAGGWMSGF